MCVIVKLRYLGKILYIVLQVLALHVLRSNTFVEI